MITAFGTTYGSANENQDAFFVGAHSFGVFDGHGRDGRAAATTACAIFATDTPRPFEQTEDVLKAYVGGTTASWLYIDPIDGHCQVAHVGDSEVRYFDEDTGDGVSLTEDHSACSLEEFKRIKACPDPCRFEFVSRYESGRPVFIKSDEWILNPAGGYSHCTVRKDWAAYVVSPVTGRLAFTRTLGDVHMKKHGVIAEPSVTTAPPPTGMRAIVLATDGMWDVMHYADVRTIVRRPDLLGNAEAATAALMEKVHEVSKQIPALGGDDVTIVVVYMTASV